MAVVRSCSGFHRSFLGLLLYISAPMWGVRGILYGMYPESNNPGMGLANVTGVNLLR